MEVSIHRILISLFLCLSLTEESCDFDTAWPYERGEACSAWTMPDATDGEAGFQRAHSMPASFGSTIEADANVTEGASSNPVLGMDQGREQFLFHNSLYKRFPGLD